jgi:excisionase family DNA binding protein
MKEVPTMQAYATAERLALDERLGVLDPPPLRHPSEADVSNTVLLDQLLGRLADLFVERLMESAPGGTSDQACDWMDARGAAEYLGLHRDTVRKLAAQRAIPAHQDGPRCKLYFRRDELDHWRRSARPTGTPRLRAV